jgi:hypothetical protein
MFIVSHAGREFEFLPGTVDLHAARYPSPSARFRCAS